MSHGIVCVITYLFKDSVALKTIHTHTSVLEVDHTVNQLGYCCRRMGVHNGGDRVDDNSHTLLTASDTALYIVDQGTHTLSLTHSAHGSGSDVCHMHPVTHVHA